jgi:F0F1-type ATP synthase membrane subunit b/b'
MAEHDIKMEKENKETVAKLQAAGLAEAKKLKEEIQKEKDFVDQQKKEFEAKLQQITKEDSKNAQQMVEKAKQEVKQELSAQYEADKKKIQNEKVQSLMQVESDSQTRVK